LVKHADHTHCHNCGAALGGPYCAQCGQHAHESARTFAALFHDAWHVTTHLDGRLWQTLYFLLLRPGRLTVEYFEEHRARYLPPVRVYLVLSVLFFAFGTFSSHHEVFVVHEPANPVTPAPAKPVAADDDDAGSGNDVLGFHYDYDDCASARAPVRWLDGLLRDACLRNKETRGEQIKATLLGNVPKMMFVFVPLIALPMLLLYWRPRRLYVEHVVFFLHTHAAMFMILLLGQLLAWLATIMHLRSIRAWVITFFVCYSAWYLFRAMRVYYGQSRRKTFAKYVVVGLVYSIGLVITLAITLLASTLIA
jgi:Protein of unknown function (DUF3667)